jgi:hypothetical protein
LVEGAGFEIRCTCKRTVGSNPTLSAIISFISYSYGSEFAAAIGRRSSIFALCKTHVREKTGFRRDVESSLREQIARKLLSDDAPFSLVCSSRVRCSDLLGASSRQGERTPPTLNIFFLWYEDLLQRGVRRCARTCRVNTQKEAMVAPRASTEHDTTRVKAVATQWQEAECESDRLSRRRKKEAYEVDEDEDA